ncbi:unnamed protein product [Tuber aestivum]|uniref:Uncharacterized protein n=1 Tax=Tuber aestivum TaxID=59557 RepID=A0A292Q8W5_9PEZI|nr:unnamed protein product [Tuber aestivum]
MCWLLTSSGAWRMHCERPRSATFQLPQRHLMTSIPDLRKRRQSEPRKNTMDESQVNISGKFSGNSGDNNVSASYNTDINLRYLNNAANLGTIYQGCVISAAAPEASRPCRMIPYSRNTRFTGRKSILDSVKSLSQCNGHNRIALLGLGGSGKTQIALEYVYQCASESGCDIFWVQGSGVLKFMEGFRAIAQHVGIPLASAETEEEGILLSVRRWFEGADSGNWILVMDNADNEEDFASNNSPIAKFVPQGPRGTLIFTTRSRQVALRQACQRIEVGKMEEDEARALFSRHYDGGGNLRDGEEEVVSMILGSVGHLPLAVVGSAAFMDETETPPREYWTIFRENDTRRTKLLSQQFSDIRRDVDMTESILSTYFITFDRITEQMPAAGDLLRLIAFFERQNIPEQLLRESGVEGMDDPVEFRLAVGKVSGFSLVTATIGKDTTFYELHRLVQLSIQAYLSPEELNKWRTTALRVISRIFPKYEHKLRNICDAYIPHALAVTGGQTDVIAEDLCFRMAEWFLNLGSYDRAEVQIRRCIRLREEHKEQGWDKGHWRLMLLGRVSACQGKAREAKMILQSVLDELTGSLGPNDLDAVACLSYLGNVMSDLGEYVESEAMNRRVLEGRGKILGAEHPDTLISVGNLATVLRNQRKYDESEAMDRRALEGREKGLGPDHPDTLTSLNNLAITLKNQGKYDESEAMHRRALEGREKVLGPDHPRTLLSLSNLALVLDDRGKYDESEMMDRRALEGREKVLGPDHPDTLRSLNNLAITLQNQGKYDESEALHHRALQRRGEVLGPDHPHTPSSLHNLAAVLGAQGKYV